MYNFNIKVSLDELGEAYKGIVLEFKKPSIGEAQMFQKLEMMDETLKSLYVGTTPTAEEFAQHFMTFDVQALIIQAFTSISFLAQTKSEVLSPLSEEGVKELTN